MRRYQRRSQEMVQETCGTFRKKRIVSELVFCGADVFSLL